MTSSHSAPTDTILFIHGREEVADFALAWAIEHAGGRASSDAERRESIATP